MKRNTLTTAISAALVGVVGMASVAGAQTAPAEPTGVKINPDGVGEVLIYPYYTARNGNNTLISVVNTSDQYVIAKVRFLEALNSREVLDFNLYLSPYDVWAAAVIDNDGIPAIEYNDTTCTAPDLRNDDLYLVSGDGADSPDSLYRRDFLNFEFTTDVQTNDATTFPYDDGRDFRIDGGPVVDERMGSGYIEVIEMGIVLDTDIQADIKHDSTRVPDDCPALTTRWEVENADPTDTDGWNAGDVGAPIGALFGSASIINVTDATQIAYDPVALQNFWSKGTSDVPANFPQGYVNNPAVGDNAHVAPGTIYPTLGGVVGFGANTAYGNKIATVGAQNLPMGFDLPVQAVSAVLTKSALFNEYVVDSAFNAQTEWVMTFPTKRFHTDTSDWRLPLTAGVVNVEDVNPGVVGDPFAAFTDNDAISPFTEVWSLTETATDVVTGFNAACEELSFVTYDREEQKPAAETGTVTVSPQPPGQQREVFSVCREANVLRFTDEEALTGGDAQTEILDEINYRSETLGGQAALDFRNFDLSDLGYSSGWVSMDLTTYGIGGSQTRSMTGTVASGLALEAGTSTAGEGNAELRGLPVIGFAATTVANGAIEDTLRNYGSSFEHKGTRTILVSSGT